MGCVGRFVIGLAADPQGRTRTQVSGGLEGVQIVL